MEPIEAFQKIIYKYVAAYAKRLGQNFTSPLYKPSALTVFPIASMIIFSMIEINTCYTDDAGTCLQSILMILIAAQGISKAYVNITFATKLRTIITNLSELYKHNETNTSNYELFVKFVRWNLLITKVYIVVLTATYAMCLVIPLVIFFVSGTMEPILPVHLPFVRSDTVSGYILHCVYNFKMATIAYMGISASDIFYISITMHIWPMVAILERSVKRLNLATTVEKQGSGFETMQNSIWLRSQMRNIVLMHREVYEYVQDLSNIFYPVVTIELYTDEMNLIIAIYTIVVMNWLPGVFFFACMFMKLFFFCSLGTAVDIMNDRVYDCLVDINFVILPPHEKKLLLAMIHAAQHPAIMRAGLVPLNLMTFVEVMKTIYSVAMLLMESV